MLSARPFIIWTLIVGCLCLLGLAACDALTNPAPTAPPALSKLLTPTANPTDTTNSPTPAAATTVAQAPTATPVAATATLKPSPTLAPATAAATATTSVTASLTVTVSATRTITVAVASTITTTAQPAVTTTAPSATVATPSNTPAAASASPTPCFGSISGQVIYDLNANHQADANEPGMLGATILLKNSSLIGVYTTGNGQFNFPGLLAGTYTLSVTAPPGYVSEDASTVSVNVTCGATVTQNFLNITVPQTPAPTATSTPTVTTGQVPATPTARALTSSDTGPKSNATGFTPFTAAPVSYIDGCGSINSPGTYLLSTSLTSEWDCIQVFSDNVIFDCQGNSLNGTDGNGYGIVVHHTSVLFGRPVRNIEIRNCNMTQHRYGIFIDAADNLYIHDNNTSGNYTDTDKRNYGIFLGLAEGGGIRVNDTRGALISNNRADGMQAIGIDVRQSDGIIVRDNTANGNSAWGIHLYGVIYSEVSGNTSTNNIRYCTWGSGVVGAGCDAGGIMIQGGSSYDVIKNNTITGDNGNGIFIKAHGEPCGDNNILANNKIVGAKYNSIELSFCHNNVIEGNEISNSLDAIWLGFATGTQVNGGNFLHDNTNHGIISWNSQNNNVSDNRIVNSREALYFYSSDYNRNDFFFVPGEPSDHVSSGNCLCSNSLVNNAAAAFHLNNSIKNQLTGNTLVNNAKNFFMEGNTSGNVIENNSIQGGVYNLVPGAEPAAFSSGLPAALQVYDLRGQLLSREQLLRVLRTDSPGDSFDLRWFKFKLRASLEPFATRPQAPAPAFDLSNWLAWFGLGHAS